MGVKLIDHPGISDPDLNRIHPSTNRISEETRESIDILVDKYMRFLDKARINREVTEEMLKLAKRKGFFKNENNFSIENKDKTAFALVKPGKKDIREGLRIIYTHTDSPCLQIKPVPVRIEWDHDLKKFHLGAELSIIPYGGSVPYQWFARDCEVRGWSIKKGELSEINFNAFISDYSMHVDNRHDNNVVEAFPWEKVRLITGHGGEKKLLEWLDFESRIDFARSRLYVVPKTKTIRLEGDYIVGYGHDDRSSTYVAVEALLTAKPTYTSVMIGFDKEEVGSEGDGGAKGNFFERILGEIIARHEGKDLEDITWGLMQKVKQNSYAISGDGDIGPSHIEVDGEGIDLRSMGKLGYGTIISAHDGAFESNQISLNYMDKILCLMDKKKIRYLPVGCSHDADNFEGQGFHAQFLTNRGIPTIEFGIPINSCHAPAELIHGGDLYWTKQAYKVFFEDKGK